MRTAMTVRAMKPLEAWHEKELKEECAEIAAHGRYGGKTLGNAEERLHECN